jgi:hypothetical protein
MEQEIVGEAGVIPARYRHCVFRLATDGKSQIASLVMRYMTRGVRVN